MRRPDWRVVHQVAAWCLGYPDDDLLARVPLLRDALAEQRDSEPVRLLTRFLDEIGRHQSDALRSAYVDTFDLNRRSTLYLSYWTDGDTRRRGETIGAFKQRYRDATSNGAWLVNTHGDLPDHLPMVLEYAALADPVGGRELLQEHRPGLELIRLSLAERGSPYADVLAAVCATLPGRSPRDRAEAMAIARSGPPSETVGVGPDQGSPVLLGFPTVATASREV
ncbi:nitrate reductase molybdenum cofactor assembly chaperone [Nocardioides sp. CER19]|uniref:nitrate reductase molybdenum cofactor assembly chaperone n=1 Tax=Nocardioides sp. CER19 TaxID=3038538 RepID=UPI002447CFC2|nr:nitrate reductase molybdenum cofactor assembly chaperone [Nocardioides sp. CER19]MDH2416356.1 nitrate reductase molybdenum cofactor assembly chaperone [Nocardioides sp. CER19]